MGWTEYLKILEINIWRFRDTQIEKIVAWDFIEFYMTCHVSHRIISLKVLSEFINNIFPRGFLVFFLDFSEVYPKIPSRSFSHSFSVFPPGFLKVVPWISIVVSPRISYGVFHRVSAEVLSDISSNMLPEFLTGFLPEVLPKFIQSLFRNFSLWFAGMAFKSFYWNFCYSSAEVHPGRSVLLEFFSGFL